MNTVTAQISPQMRIVALVGVLLIVLGGASLVVLRHSKPGTVTVPPTSHATKPSATTTSLHRPTAATHPVASPTHHHVAQPKVDPRLPAVVRAALERNRLVVAGFFDPQVRVDSLTIGEAHAGAAEADVGFVRVSLLDDRVAGPLTALLPAGQLLPAPGILVYERPGKVVYRFDGYLDRAAVAQAVEAAR